MNEKIGYLPCTENDKAIFAEIISSVIPSRSGVDFMFDVNERVVWLHPPFMEFSGGLSITQRSIEELEKELPTVKQALMTTQGKIAFLGNGLSPAPLIVAKRYAEGELQEVPIIVDMFDYPKLEEDLRTLEVGFKINGLKAFFPFNEHIANVTKLNREVRLGNLKAINCCIGKEKLPADLFNLSLAINVFGPNNEALGKQPSLLKQGGQLLGVCLPPMVFR